MSEKGKAPGWGRLKVLRINCPLGWCVKSLGFAIPDIKVYQGQSHTVRLNQHRRRGRDQLIKPNP